MRYTPRARDLKARSGLGIGKEISSMKIRRAFGAADI